VPTEERPRFRPRTVSAALFLVLSTALAYGGLLRNGFVRWDDPLYITGNSHVTGGVSRAGVAWAFRAVYASNWHPLAWLSHMLDCQLYGLNPAYHHLNNLLFHIANSLLLLLLLWRLTGSALRSLLVALLFALHPLHVESVAWASERKDVLSTFFGLLALLSYERYARSPSAGRFVLTVVTFALSLLSKPMLVTLPFVFLLLDAWPLGRLALRRPVILRLLLEKLPFFLLSALSCVITVFAQSRGGAVETLEHAPFLFRFSNALVGYAFYLWKMVWPSGLAFLYPLWGSWPWPIILGAAAVLVLGSAVAIAARRRHPAVLFGWLWYLGTALPVIGLMQVGAQLAADRYTYVPLIGVFVAIVWVIPERWLASAGAAPTAGAVLLALGLVTHRQVGFWRDSETLFRRGLAVTKDNEAAHYFLADELVEQGRATEAELHYEEAIRIKMERARAWVASTVGQAQQLDFDAAFARFLEALREHPTDSRTNLAVRAFLRQSGKPDKEVAQALYRVGTVIDRRGSLPLAIGYYREAVRLDPGSARAQNDLGSALASFGELGTAIVHLSEALRLRPDSREARSNLALALTSYAQGRSSRSAYPPQLREPPDLVSANLRLGDAFRRAGQLAEAKARYDEVLRVAPGNRDAVRELATLGSPAERP
jgi:tetratricopeptide (TPR) repeat protein